MRAAWETWLKRWVEAGLIDPAAAERIRSFEATAGVPQKARWPVLTAVSLGGLMLGAGILLFVAAHWANLSPTYRFTLVLLLVGVFHAGGALLTERFALLATVLHAVGTAALGGGIFLAGQIFNLQEHWPGGLMLWAAGAWAGWWLLRDWVQAGFAALLTPAWLAGEWNVASRDGRGSSVIVAEGLLLVALTYLSARTAERGGPVRRALVLIGWLAMIPCTLAVLFNRWTWKADQSYLSLDLLIVGCAAAFGLPLLLALWLRGRAAWVNLVAAAWVLVLGTIQPERHILQHSAPVFWEKFGPYLWCAAGAVALATWGFYEARKERINLGFAGFAITVLVFYFSDVMDKLGRSASLMIAGVLFLAGGWLLERTRRRLIARLGTGES